MIIVWSLSDFGTTQFSNAAYLNGTQFNDILKGDDQHNVFYGRGGYDTYIGNGEETDILFLISH